MGGVTLETIENMDKEMLTAADIAGVVGVDASRLRAQAIREPEKLGFEVIVVGNAVKIPKRSFIHYCKYGKIYIDDEGQKSIKETRMLMQSLKKAFGGAGESEDDQ